MKYRSFNVAMMIGKTEFDGSGGHGVMTLGQLALSDKYDHAGNAQIDTVDGIAIA